MIEFFTFSGFSAAKNVWLFFGLTLAAGSFFFYYAKKDRLALLLLTLGGMCLFTFGALSDPFLHFWDERFHALVAKNCMETPLMPRLYPELPIAEFDPMIWSHAYIWLHKQPLFIWQIALCFKLFGVSEFTLRLPSVIMATLMIPLCYRIGKLFIDSRLGYYTALSAAFSWFMLDLVSGHGLSDHNNVCFAFYVTASVWSWMEYVRSGRKWGWVALTGVLSGCAILTKWLTGLLVYLVWGLYLLSKYRFCLKEWKILQFVAALTITVAVALSWQIYTIKAYPEVAKRELENNSVHFSQAVEGHHQDRDFYLKTLPFIYIGDKDCGNITSEAIEYTPKRVFHILILLAGFGLLVYRSKQWEKRIPLAVTVLFVYLFFSMAGTKLPAYPFCVCAGGFMSIGMVCCFWEEIIQKFLKNRVAIFAVWFPLMAFIALYQFNFTWYRQHHVSRYVWWRSGMIENVQNYKNLKKILPERTILFNVRATYDDWKGGVTPTEAMFYTDAICYSFTPTEEQLQMLKEQGYHIAVLTHLPVPDYMMADDEVQKIDGVKILYDL